CTTDLMLRYPHNAGAAAAVFGAMQLALGALASAAIGATGLLCLGGRMLVLRWHGRPVKGALGRVDAA
ncbi:Bcr/CflA family drug resistance efflux transporter, partial [Burkholderia pseudomallei]|nr:Bcr/CflA family drug resistance efflux transporter [Burkholderia pseudomallei]MBF3605657.1 Bcr/CflA family drug resistance efflux transporter [Burkholderia pseudomallei]